MVNRFYKDGDKLDVAGLNEITVLLDRSETESTEIGWNCWTPQQDGPPHKHNDKDQVFYVTGGVGIIKLGDKEYPAKKGCLAYVPAGLVHQTITTTEERLCYMLFNVFKSSDKEGHGTFAEHIEKVKQIRRRQAETGKTEMEDIEQLTDLKEHKYFTDVNFGKVYEFGSNTANLLVDRCEANKCELTLVKWLEGNKGAMVAHKEKEQAFFVLEGEGKVTIGDETEEIKSGHLIYVPRNSVHTTEATKGTLTYLCMNGLSEEAEDIDFETMYNRVSQDRIERWKNGSSEIGE